MKIRQHRGGLLESMQTVKNIEPTMDAIVQHIKECMPDLAFNFVKLEHCGYDDRIDWDCSYVLVDKHVFGMIDTIPFEVN